jgi:hypothetical protein
MTRPKTILALLLAFALPVQAAEWHGLLDVRGLVRATGERSWTDEGLGKLRTDADSRRVYLGQGVLRGEFDLHDTVSGTVVLNAYQDRDSVADVSEAWIAWRPVPDGPWRTRMRAGAFFPALSLENEGLGWTPTRMLSTSAINSWLGQELRLVGLELNMARPGRAAGSEHDFGMTATLFGANDPAGTLMTWQGWNVGDRVTGLTETLRLPDLPVYRPAGFISKQTRDVRLFREIDHRLGYLLAANYGYGGWIDVAAAHYDNRGDPLVVKDGQYSWTTRFDHVSARVRPWRKWDVSMQAMRGSTVMGPNAARADFSAWYALVSHPLGSGELALRHDHFHTRSPDIWAADNNDEDGRAWALAYDYPLAENLNLVVEALRVGSTRPARVALNTAPRQVSRNLTAALRWRF